MRKIIAMLVLLMFVWVELAHPQEVTTAGVELANTFQKLNTFMAGIFLAGSNSGGVTLQSAATSATYTLTMPAAAPQANQALVSSVTPGVLQFSTPCGGVLFAGDLAGNGTSQQVVGLAGIPIDQTVTPQNGWVLKYNSSTNKWVPSAE
jgi:hypothetical protein